MTPLSYASGGAIGRAITGPMGTFDARFIGDIIEVLAYDVALSDGDVTTLEKYLARHWAVGP